MVTMRMKKTQRIELLHNIRHTFVSFSAIVIFVALAAGLFTGISWTGEALDRSIEAQYSSERFHNFALSYPYGFSDEFIASLTEDGTANAAEGCYDTFRHIICGGSRYQVKLSSLTSTVDCPTCVEGTLPVNAGEAAVNVSWAAKNGLGLGDVFTIEAARDSSCFFISTLLDGTPEQLLSLPAAKSELTANTFRITAFVEAAEYMDIYADANGSAPNSPVPVETVIYVAEPSFDETAYRGYPKVVVTAGGLAGLHTSSDAYRTSADEIYSTLEEKADEYTTDRNEAILNSAESMGRKLRALPLDGAAKIRADALCAELENISGCDAFIASRQMNVSFAGVRSVMDTFEKMQYSLVSLFVVIGILVCYSTVSRLVYDQTVLIGTKKAIGFSSKEIIRPFLIYSGAAAAVGLTLGALLGRFIIEPVMVTSVRQTYRFIRAVYYFGAKELLIFALLQFVLLLLTARTASASVSKQKALKLLTGEQLISRSEHRWLEKMPFWRRTSLMKKTIIKNCLNDRRRVFATVVGVMGCTALVVCALSMYDNLVGSLDRNMEKITLFDTVVYFDGGENKEEELSAFLEQTDAQYASSLFMPGAVSLNGGKQVVAKLYVTDDESFFSLVRLYDAYSGEEKRMDSGAWINIAYAENNSASVGDTISYTDASGQAHEFTIEGIFDYYLMNYVVVLPKELYEDDFGTAYEPNSFIINTDADDPDAIKESLLSIDKELVFKDFRGGNKNLFESIAGIARAVSAVYLVLSAILAVLLLLNLFTMFVSEKKKELITLMINGFSRKAAERYIYSDARLLTVLGIAAGLAVGIVMGKFSLDSFNNDSTHFLNSVDITACVAGILFASILTHIMCRIALRKVRKFSLADINSL